MTDFPNPGIKHKTISSVARPRIQAPFESRNLESTRLNTAHTPIPSPSQSACLWRKKRGWPRFSAENAPTLASMIRPIPIKPATQTKRVRAVFRPMRYSVRSRLRQHRHIRRTRWGWRCHWNRCFSRRLAWNLYLHPDLQFLRVRDGV